MASAAQDGGGRDEDNGGDSNGGVQSQQSTIRGSGRDNSGGDGDGGGNSDSNGNGDGDSEDKDGDADVKGFFGWHRRLFSARFVQIFWCQYNMLFLAGVVQFFLCGVLLFRRYGSCRVLTRDGQLVGKPKRYSRATVMDLRYWDLPDNGTWFWPYTGFGGNIDYVK